MSYFHYRGGHYCVEQVRIGDIVNDVGTPFYCYSAAAIETAYQTYVEAFAGKDMQICYAIKANSNQSIVKLFADAGAGADVVSVGELKRALLAGIPAEKIVYSGVAKTRTDIEFALSKNIRQFNVESEPELAEISAAAVRLGRTAPIAFRINPDVDAETHEKIATGKSENKFGIPWQSASSAYKSAASLPGIRVCGIDMHIGSQIGCLNPYKKAFRRIAKLTTELRADGHDITTIDLGGGLAVNYDRAASPVPGVKEYAKVAIEALHGLDCRLILEPGRSLVAKAGILVTRVIYVKRGTDRNFLIVDAAMNDFLRPSMYNAHHDIVSAASEAAQLEEYDIVGPVCETGDTFARSRELPIQKAGETIVIEGAGAYGAVMASTYNTRALIPEILVRGDRHGVIRPRIDEDGIIALDRVWPA